jgi:hypothetical protein
MLTFKGMMDELNIKHAAFVCLDETCLRTAAALKMMALTYEFKGNMKKRVGGIKFGATAEFARLGVPALFMVCILFLVKNLSLNSPCICRNWMCSLGRAPCRTSRIAKTAILLCRLMATHQETLILGSTL